MSIQPKIAMMHRGQTVAYQFIGDADADFEPGESVSFLRLGLRWPAYRQAVHNQQRVLAVGRPDQHANNHHYNANQTSGTVTTSAVMTVTREPENFFTSTYTNQWDSFPNQPDAWYWDYVRQTRFETAVTRTYTITLPNPILASPEPAIYTVELLSRERSTDATGITYDVTATINDHPTGSTATLDQREKCQHY